MNFFNTVWFQVIFVTAILGILFYSFYVSAKRKKALGTYALAQGWKPFELNGLTAQKYVPEKISRNADRHDYDLGYQLKVNERDAVLFKYTNVRNTRDTDGSQSTRRTHYTILAFELPGLSSLEIIKHSFFTALDVVGTKKESLKLEGDFNKDFDVIMADGGQVDALTVLSPDTMVLIQDLGKDFNIQILGGWVVLYGDEKHLDLKHLTVLLEYASKLESELSQKVKQAPISETLTATLSTTGSPPIVIAPSVNSGQITPSILTVPEVTATPVAPAAPTPPPSNHV